LIPAIYYGQFIMHGNLLRGHLLRSGHLLRRAIYYAGYLIKKILAGWSLEVLSGVYGENKSYR